MKSSLKAVCWNSGEISGVGLTVETAAADFFYSEGDETIFFSFAMSLPDSTIISLFNLII